MTRLEPSQPSVLVIGADPRVADALGPALERDGFGCQSASSAGEGYRLYLEGAFPVLMLDEALPVLGGLGLLRLIRLLDHSTTILLISGVTDLCAAVSALRAGADDYVSRPFKLWDLKERIGGSRSRRAVVARQSRPRQAARGGKAPEEGRFAGLPKGLGAHLERLRRAIEVEIIGWPGFFEEVGAQAMAAAEKLSVREGDRRLLGRAAELHFLGFGGEEPSRIQEALLGPEEFRGAWRGSALASAALLDHMGPEAARCAGLLRAAAQTEGRSGPKEAETIPPLAGILWRSLLLVLGRTWKADLSGYLLGAETARRMEEGDSRASSKAADFRMETG